MNDLNITLTEAAAKIISDTIEDQTVSDPYLAFYVVGGGCSGLQYGLALAEGEPEIDDIIVYDKDIKIAVESSSAKYVNGCVINYQEKGLQSGFKVENPNAENGDFKDYINENSLQIVKEAKIENELAKAIASDKFQFLRLGYFCLDKNSTYENLIFNKTVGLKDSWAKEVVKG